MQSENTNTNSNTQQNEADTSTLIFVKSHSVGEDSKGRQKVDLRFSEEETKQIIAELSKIKSRAKIQVHIGETSAFLFVKEVQERGASFGPNKKSAGGNGYKPATGGADVRAKLAGMKKQA